MIIINEKYQINSIFILETLDDEGEINGRGSCFAIAPDLILTARHVISNRDNLRCYLKSDDYKNEKFHTLELVYQSDDWDFAILRLTNKKLSDFIKLGDVEVSISTLVQVCGYPMEAGYIHSPFEVAVSNIYSGIQTHNYSFELSQSPTVAEYHGMSGSPVLYKGYAIGVLVVQRGSTILKVLSNSDIIGNIPKLIKELILEPILQEEIEYSPPPQPPSPFSIRLNCHKVAPNIKALEIGFDFSVWRVNSLVDCAREWLIDYALSASVKKSLENRIHSQIRVAFEEFEITDINAMNDLFLHMAIRENYKTIPVINKVINTHLGSAFSSSHIVLEKGNIEIWLGASSIQNNVKNATIQVIKNIEVLLSVNSIEERLILITEEMDNSWPFKDKLEKISDNTMPMSQRFDKIVVPIFITHDSDAINKYNKDEDKYNNDIQKDIDECRLILINSFSSDIINVVDLKIFIFPVDNISDLHSQFKKGISL